MLAQFLPYTVVHRLYLPKPLAEKSPRLAKEIGAVAEEAGCEVFLYDETLPFSPLRSFGMQISVGEDDTKAMTLDANGHRLSLVDPSRMTDGTWKPFLANSHTVLLSCSSCEDESLDPVRYVGESTKQIVISHAHTHECTPVWEGAPTVYCYPFDGKKRTLSFFLD